MFPSFVMPFMRPFQSRIRIGFAGPGLWLSFMAAVSSLSATLRVFHMKQPLIGWSMTKSVINALTGILVGQGKLSLEDRALLPEWRGPGDPRAHITLDQLLRMSSGLKFAEDYANPLEDVIFMLLGTDDVAAYAANKPLEAEPGTKWYYSSGTTNIIARIMRDAIGGTDADYFAFPRRALFDPMGMHSAIIEPDASGTFVGSSLMYATARDWARFGLLYLQDGVWEGERILPEGWVKYTLTPAPRAPLGEYGAHFWLKVPPPFKSSVSGMPSLPVDTYFAAGHEGQFVTIIPSRKLVVVRLGLSRLKGAWDQEWFIAQILEAIPEQRAGISEAKRPRTEPLLELSCSPSGGTTIVGHL